MFTAGVMFVVSTGCHEGNHPQNRCVRPLTGMSNPLYGSIPLQRSQYYQATPGRNSLLPASHRPNQHDLCVFMHIFTHVCAFVLHWIINV